MQLQEEYTITFPLAGTVMGIKSSNLRAPDFDYSGALADGSSDQQSQEPLPQPAGVSEETEAAAAAKPAAEAEMQPEHGKTTTPISQMANSSDVEKSIS